MEELVHKKFPSLLTYGCSAHYVNLIEKDVAPRSELKHIVEVQKYYRNHHQPHGWLKEKCRLMPQLPNETRWNLQHSCVQTVIKDYRKYIEIQNEHKDIDHHIGQILNNTGLYKEALHLEQQLKTVSLVLDKLSK